MTVERILNYLQARLLEPSSLRGLIWLAAGTGIVGKSAAADITAPEAIIALAAIVAGLVGMFSKEGKHIVEVAGTVTQADSVERAEIVVDSQHTIQRFDTPKEPQ